MLILLVLFHSEGSPGYWKVQYENVVYGIYEVDFVDTLHGWAVGDHGFVLRTNNGGESWDTLWTPDIPEPLSGDFELLGCCFLDTNIGWVCGDSGYIAKTEDGGDSWVVQDTDHYESLYVIEFFDSLYGWSSGENDTTILKTTDGGNNWNKIQFPGNEWAGAVSISILSEQDIWVLEDFGSLYFSNDGGISWVEKLVEYYQGYKVVALDFSHIWVSADSLNNPRIYRSSDGGETWLRTNGALGWGLDFVDTLYGWAGGEYSGYFLTQDGGETYEQYENNGLGYICDIDLVDRKHGWAAAYYPLTFERNRGEVHRWIPDTSGIHEIEDDFNRKTAIIFCTDRVSLGKGRYSIYDNTGSLVKVISNYWNGDDNKGETVPPGIYFGKQREKTVRIIKIK